ncbi:hypothetical protein IGI04_042200, partial [Brassica rapa subsp. trilocularis]
MDTHAPFCWQQDILKLRMERSSGTTRYGRRTKPFEISRVHEVVFYTQGKCDSAHHMSHTDLKLLSFLADSSPAVYPVIYYLVPFLVEPIHLRNKKEKFREKERKKERKILSICVCSDQSDHCGDFKSRIFQKPSVISLSSSIVFLSQSHGIKVRVPYDISPCPDELTIRYCFLGLKSLEWYPIGALVFFDCWSKAIGSILRTSDRPSRNIDR